MMLHSLKYVLNFEWLSHVGVGTAKCVFLALFVISGLLVLMIPGKSIYEGIENPLWWHNLKLWAFGVLAIIFAIYVIF